MCSSECTRRALSRRNRFLSEAAAHNRKLNIEAGVASLFTSDVLLAKGRTWLLLPVAQQ